MGYLSQMPGDAGSIPVGDQAVKRPAVRDTLEAERAGRFNESSIHSIFRVMHTIKSSSAMMGINGLSSLAHKLEDLFSYYRENMDKLEHPEPDLFDLLFAASDFIAQELEQMNRRIMRPGIRLCLSR